MAQSRENADSDLEFTIFVLILSIPKIKDSTKAMLASAEPASFKRSCVLTGQRSQSVTSCESGIDSLRRMNRPTQSVLRRKEQPSLVRGAGFESETVLVFSDSMVKHTWSYHNLPLQVSTGPWSSGLLDYHLDAGSLASQPS